MSKKNSQKVQRHFKCNKQFTVQYAPNLYARYVKIRTESGYACIGMYDNAMCNAYEKADESSVDKVMLCWVGGQDIIKVQDKIIFK